MIIERASAARLTDWTALRRALWLDEDQALLATQAADWLRDPAHGQHAWLAVAADGTTAGFAEATLRHDYVNGCNTSPVAFLEGLFVAPAFRRRGIARALVTALAEWAGKRGIAEFASDALLDNSVSHAMHGALGFSETERVVYFRRSLQR